MHHSFADKKNTESHLHFRCDHQLKLNKSANSEHDQKHTKGTTG